MLKAFARILKKKVRKEKVLKRRNKQNEDGFAVWLVFLYKTWFTFKIILSLVTEHLSHNELKQCLERLKQQNTYHFPSAEW